MGRQTLTSGHISSWQHIHISKVQFVHAYSWGKKGKQEEKGDEEEEEEEEEEEDEEEEQEDKMSKG